MNPSFAIRINRIRLRSPKIGLNQRTGNSWHFSRIEKLIIGITIAAILLVSAFGFLLNTAKPAPPEFVPDVNDPTATPSPAPTSDVTPDITTSATQKPQPTAGSTRAPWVPVGTGPQGDPTRGPGLVESNPAMDSLTWSAIARNAWNYFQPGRGIDSTTGLPASSQGWNYFTDWDLGVYIQAVINAQKIGLISTSGEWGSHARLEKVITFLETRELVNGTIPYWFYCSDGKGYTYGSSVDLIDTGTLLAALSNLKPFDSSFTSRIDNIVYNGLQNNRTDYAALVPVLKNYVTAVGVYDYYMLTGFAFFWPDEVGHIPNSILNNMRNADTVTAYNVSLPKASLLCEPLLYSVFNFNNSNVNLTWLMNVTYSAHEARYNATGQYVAYSEGISSVGFVWEWVVSPDMHTWKITASNGSYININPVIYNKIALSFLSLYNTTFPYKMSVYLEKLSSDPSVGYCAGADYNENANLTNVYLSVDSNTNGLILSAARYALRV